VRGWRRRPSHDELPEGFPDGFRVQRLGVAVAKAIADLAPADIAKYFGEHPEAAKGLVDASYDKRFTPSTFIVEEGDVFKVGWFSSRLEYECVQQFSNLADAAADYVLFSLGKGRWTQSITRDSN
jgi:hypothetical protein